MSPSSSSPALAALISFLKERSAAVKKLENDGLHALYEAKDDEGYRALMRQRAEVIAALDADAQPLTAALDEPLRDEAETCLRRFAKGGRNALRIGSVFYMSALLYPDEHTAGQPDNLELFIDELESY